MQQAAITREARGKEKNETVEENDGKLTLKSEELRLFRKRKKKSGELHTSTASATTNPKTYPNIEL